jgi:hypothetical protein
MTPPVILWVELHELHELEVSMLTRVLMLAMLSGGAVGALILASPTTQADQKVSSQDHIAWVAQALRRMRTIQPGMRRSDLLKVFTIEGGLSARSQRTYVSRDCPYFKVDFDFKPVGPADGGVGSEMTHLEGSRDIIVKMSRPYLQFAISD